MDIRAVMGSVHSSTKSTDRFLSYRTSIILTRMHIVNYQGMHVVNIRDITYLTSGKGIHMRFPQLQCQLAVEFLSFSWLPIKLGHQSSHLAGHLTPSQQFQGFSLKFSIPLEVRPIQHHLDQTDLQQARCSVHWGIGLTISSHRQPNHQMAMQE